MLISRRAVAEYLEREFNSYLWMKRLSAEKILGEINQLKVRPRFKTEPWLHQLVCFYIALFEPRFLFLLDMGTGKTKILLDVLTQLIREKRVERGLVTVPRLINIDSWVDDMKIHCNLEPNRIDCSEIEEKRERLLRPTGELTLIDNQGLYLALSKKKKGGGLQRDERLVRQVQKLYGYIGLDEIHNQSNAQTLQYGILRKLTRRAEYVYGSTGTLFGSNVEAIHPQFYLVDQGETFGESLGIFRAALFTSKTDPWKGEVWTFNKRMDHQLHAMLQHKSIRYEESEVHDLPKRVSIRKVYDMGEEQREHYLRALEGLINANGKLSELDAQWIRMRQISSGYLAWKDDLGDHVLRFKHNPKLEGLVSIVEEIGRSKIVICYDYTETGRMIVERLTAEGHKVDWLWGGTKDRSALRQRFINDPKHRVLVMNSTAGGTGNDGLQKVAKYMSFYESPTSPITRKQTEKRIHRPGQDHRSFIIDQIMDQSLEAGILANIAEGIDCHERVVNGRLPAKKFFLTAAHER